MAVDGSAPVRRRLDILLVLLLITLMPLLAWADDPGWLRYQQGYISDAGRVVDTGNGDISHTEGQGWGMLMAVHFDDRERFEQLYRWTREHLYRPVDGLYTWRYQPDVDPDDADPNNATDGDLLIAWALEWAGRHWRVPAYRADALALRESIRRHLIVEYAGYLVLLPGRDGFVHDGYVHLNPSYWVMPALDYFAAVEPNGPWRQLMYDGIRLMHRARFGEDHLVPDWLRLEKDGDVALAEPWPPRFGFEAVRVPLYLYWIGLGDAALLDGLRRYWLRPRPPAWVDLETGATADFPLSEGAMAVRALLLGNGATIALTPNADADYYSASLQMLGRMALDTLKRPYR